MTSANPAHNVQLTEAQLLVLKAALFELDRAWRRGTANSGFHDKTMGWLRGSRPVHESEVRRLLETLDKPGVHVTLAVTTQ
jgi:hypothetical protein